jgi:hypothetical protein
MKKHHLLILAAFLFFTHNAQTFQWAKAEGHYAYDYGYGTVTDNAGNLYVVGKYEENGATFSGSTVTCAGNHDGFIAKYSPTGSLIWVKTAGGANGDYFWHATTDKANFIIVSGEMEGYGTISFPGSTVTLQGQGDNDIWFAKYDLNGNLLWAKSEGYKNSEKGLSITHDSNNNIYVAGYFTDTTKINGSFVFGKGGRDIFVAKYDANGNFLWVRTAGSTARDEVKSVKCDASGNVYIAGWMSNNTMFGSQNYQTYNNTNYADAFIAKYASDGTLQWVKNMGGDYDDVAWGMIIDNNGKIFVTGEFNAYAVFGTPATNLTTSGNADVFIACFDNAGNAQWARKAGGTLIDRARGIGSDGDNIFVTGQFGATAAFGSTNLTASDSSDIFVTALDNAGNFMWSIGVGGKSDTLETLGYESGNAICSPGNGVVYATGGLLSGGTFGGINIGGYTRTDAFVARIDGIVGLNEQFKNLNVKIYPNPATGKFNITTDALNDKLAVSVYNNLGQPVLDHSVSNSNVIEVQLNDQPNGVYFLELRAGNKSSGRCKLIVQH